MALERFDFLGGLANTAIIVAGVEVGRLLSVPIAAYAFARINFPFRRTLFVLVLATMMLPFHVVMIPIYIIFRMLGWLDTLLRHRTTGEWLEAFDKADIPAMPVRTLEELFDDPHLKATGFFTEREHPTEGPITTFASPLDFEKTKVEFRRHAPRIGEDGVEVLREAGVCEADIAKLRADGALIVPSD